MNAAKHALVKDMLRKWRVCATAMAALQWRCFFAEGQFDPFYDPATRHRKEGAEARLGLLLQISGYYSLESSAARKKRLPEMISGLVDPLASMKASIGAAQVQMVREQVLGTLNSFISNRQNDFIRSVFVSTISADQRHAHFVINRMKAWFDLKRPLHVKGELIAMSVRRLAQNIMRQILRRHRLPSFSRIGMVVDQRIASMAAAEKAKSFDFWLKLQMGRGRGGSLAIPVNGYERFKQRRGERKKSFQIIEDRETGLFTVGVITDVGKAFAASTESYRLNPERNVSLDFGLTTMFATGDGDLLGRNFLGRLKALDATISGIARHVQRSGAKPRTSVRYRRHVTRARGFITTEINRVINRLIATHKPTRLVLERLDFRVPGLSKRLNRIIQNCGRSVLNTKLVAIQQEFGIESTQVVSAYTSQTCSCCGYVDKRNRRNQARFACLWCGNKIHADVNASRNIGSERFRSFPALRPGFRKTVLQLLVREHLERHTRRIGSPADPRDDSSYFNDHRHQVRYLPSSAQALCGKTRQVELTT
ncbi:zinc ribbon domain-containing protein [Aliirhizobium cellulosilyticum]|uniref:Putative transposase n=1 Tax=Aliirhizobium cellulosilyticum TaxID=393664 RepID=A0A7W6THG4_9HYPH|nr:zinc ribbon domain-containing protein [Rhizobium cellulosilyticum]MBB4349407.1 putative transposase [Rhizobium cellulosilyticum]MBB4412371.1 putative transposase [Rhizobium cellulosilyticum]MBB4447003.1 putative transposase [Rhizobium cellulosilyticum]